MSEHEAKIQEILAAFQPEDGIYKRQAVDEAVALKEEITPYLLEILKDTMADPNKYIEGVDISHIYAFILLGYFKEPRAHQVMVDLFSLPEALIDRLFGDMITEDLGIMLFRTYNGSVDDLKRLIVNKDAYEYCRGAALDALTYAVVEGMVSREETLDFLSTLFTGDEDNNPDSGFWTFVADSIRDLYPEELMPLIEQAFERDMIDLMFFGPEIFTETLQQSRERTLQKTREELQRRSPVDIHRYISWWAMFEQETPPLSQRGTQTGRLPASSAAAMPRRQESAPAVPRPPSKQEKAKKKQKRKMAQASKKKNRRR